jgi:ArsR family transcriptional regulator
MQFKKQSISAKEKEFDPESFASMCKALGHPARVMIVNYLNRIDRCLCGDIVDLLPLAQSTVSQHLKCLKEAGLVKGEVEGPKTCYCLDKRMLKKFTRMTRMVADLGLSPHGEKQ